MRRHAAVVGGGLQGSLAALELAACGFQVTLFERDPVLMGRASRWNEGKIHLGYIYANDPSLRTARLMARGAMSFGRLLSRHIDDDVARAGRSESFKYAVLEDSILSPDQLAGRYAEMDVVLRDELAAGGRYLGEVPAPVQRVDPESHGFGRRVQALFSTSERSVEVHGVADAVAGAVHAASGIEVVLGHAVDALQRGPDGRLRLLVDDQVAGPFDHVVNAAWDGRLTLDATAGVHVARPHVFRFKYAVHLDGLGDATFPTTSFVLGPYGDAVRFERGSAYLSWYPAGCTATTLARDVPRDWGQVPDAEALMAPMVEGLSALHPAIGAAAAAAASSRIAGGVIFSWGDTDIDDPASELHRRHDVGVTTHGGDHHTIDTGKYTLAPMFAAEVARRVAGERVAPVTVRTR